MRLRSTARLLVLMLAVALATAGCGGPIMPGGIAGYVVQFAGAQGASGDSVGALSVTPTPGETPVEGAKVEYQGPSGIGFVLSGSDGYFFIGNLIPGWYRVTITHPKFVGSYTSMGRVYAGQTAYVGDVHLGSVRILTIGINDYVNPSAPDLAGAARDAEMLFNQLNTDNQLVREAWILKDSQATKTAIQSAIQNIGAEMGPGDTFIMAYSGHGMRDDIGNKEYIIPHDYSGTLSSAISDSELSSWIASYMPYNTSVFVFDSCNSGGMASAAGFLPRGMVLSTTFETMARNISGTNRVVMTAATKYEVSYESELPMPGGFNEDHGHFAYSFARGMWEAYNLPDTTTYPADSNPRDGQVSCQEAFDYANYFIDYQVDQCTWPVQTPQIFDPGNIADETYIFMY